MRREDHEFKPRLGCIGRLRHNEIALFNLGMVLWNDQYVRYPTTGEVEAAGQEFKVILDYISSTRPVGHERPCLKTTTRLPLPFLKLSLVLSFFTNTTASQKNHSFKKSVPGQL